MTLRNGSLEVSKLSAPNNIYRVERREIIPAGDTSIVKIRLVGSTDGTEDGDFSSHEFTLEGLPVDPAQLNPVLYQSELLSQYPDEIVDKTALKDFTILAP